MAPIGFHKMKKETGITRENPLMRNGDIGSRVPVKFISRPDAHHTVYLV
jgi:hypothetical protein